MFMMAKFGSHSLARQAVCAPQNDAASFRERPADKVTTYLSL
jgi:hypothetical protein